MIPQQMTVNLADLEDSEFKARLSNETRELSVGLTSTLMAYLEVSGFPTLCSESKKEK